jgi:hypothetical protein
MRYSSAKGLIYFILAKIFVFVFALLVKHKRLSCFTCFLGLLYTLLLYYIRLCNQTKFWHQEENPLFVMSEVPVSQKDGDDTGLYSGLCCTLFKRYALNKQQVQCHERGSFLAHTECPG